MRTLTNSSRSWRYIHHVKQHLSAKQNQNCKRCPDFFTVMPVLEYLESPFHAGSIWRHLRCLWSKPTWSLWCPQVMVSLASMLCSDHRFNGNLGRHILRIHPHLMHQEVILSEREQFIKGSATELRMAYWYKGTHWPLIYSNVHVNLFLSALASLGFLHF